VRIDSTGIYRRWLQWCCYIKSHPLTSSLSFRHRRTAPGLTHSGPSPSQRPPVPSSWPPAPPSHSQASTSTRRAAGPTPPLCPPPCRRRRRAPSPAPVAGTTPPAPVARRARWRSRPRRGPSAGARAPAWRGTFRRGPPSAPRWSRRATSAGSDGRRRWMSRELLRCPVRSNPRYSKGTYDRGAVWR